MTNPPPSLGAVTLTFPVLRSIRRALVLLALAGLLAGCGELQPIEYTRASTTTTDPMDGLPDDTVAPEAPTMRSARYVVQPGDTMGSIAAAHGVSIELLMSFNDMTDSNRLEAGVTLRIPGPNETVPPRWQQEQLER
jgi:hypothetical protein